MVACAFFHTVLRIIYGKLTCEAFNRNLFNRAEFELSKELIDLVDSLSNLSSSPTKKRI